MIEFETLCFLQNQKTGCTFVETLLRQFCTEGLRRYEKHARLRKVRPGVFYFIGIREPLEVYSSLFRYGLDGRGEIFIRLKAAGKANLYSQGVSGFTEWLRYILDIKNSHIIMPDAPQMVTENLGLNSWRYLRLAVPELSAAARSKTTRDQIRELESQHTVIDRVIRHEQLSSDLHALFHGPLSAAVEDLDAIDRWLMNTPRINASRTTEQNLPGAIPTDLMEQLHSREWFIYEKFYSEPVPQREPT